MNITHYADSALSLLPPLIALGMAIVTRRVLLSLGIGIVVGTFLLVKFSIPDFFIYLANAVKGLFIEDGGLNSWNMSIIGFLLLLGMITALLTLSGGTQAFADWAKQKIHSKRGAKLLAAFLGIFIFVDDYFNSLAVGAISRPVTDKFHVSRAKLAYILDSTAAPMCVLTPVSSWGAYIITLIGGILVSHGMTEGTALGAFVSLVPMNFYALFALLMVLAVAWFHLDIGAMRKQEKLAEQAVVKEQSFSAEEMITLEDELTIKQSDNGRVSDLTIPIVVLVIATISAMILTGTQALSADNKAFTLLGALENTDVGLSLCYGGVIGLLVALFSVIRQRLPVTDIRRALFIGARSMLGAILILFFAWMIGGIIKDVETGKYLSTLVQGNLNPQLLPLILFLLSGVMAFATGTSWGTFGIMLPIAGDLAGVAEPTLMLPVLAAVLAGSVFGDHCSPISDTTILSSTGANCHHIDHVVTQLPYALIVAAMSAVGYLVLGLSGSVALAFAVVSVCFVAGIFVLTRLTRTS
ncbi:MAG: Na+/H+ antiporter [Gammaproteobacteria bacterium]|nr:MAG: Na+/H+ antiporter [Gammaproteobacteria bacterium]